MAPIVNFPFADGKQRRTLRHDREEGAMRVIDCPCGHRLEGADDEELFRLAREHVDRDHPEMQRTDEQLRERVAADAYDG
jgi:predicted small metal-binding protein